ncbi:MAG: hypothetical protein LC104_13910 [Bacteroidales bacterium]|nr:hypothetical protein [Bacteroidales bacterium]
MAVFRCWLAHRTAGLGLAVAVITVTGCQTYPAGFGGLTLPSPHYLKHYPQYFPPDPPFKLQRELESMQDPEQLFGARPGAALPAPSPIPPGAVEPVPAAPMGMGDGR